ncbi:probable L-ascorbate peroxidase 8, chloroplastic [Miscanthus floridulus]|uniref:probable L-ascorbate peroxidase 8, chloroplastic n=1 Tax=Miscanthus floridulus TaxID=154761 RepID=UPI0034583BA7
MPEVCICATEQGRGGDSKNCSDNDSHKQTENIFSGGPIEYLKGLINALKLIQPIKDKYPGITYADLFQLASAMAIEEAGGPKIPMKYGRVDVTAAEQCPPEGRLPDAGPRDPAEHLREVFYRMGLDDKEIVALSGAHTLGRARPDRSGWGKPETKYTKDGPGEPRGQSWTVEWLKWL